MGTRAGLSALIKKTLADSNIVAPFNVYFQPPATQIMKYPCVVYARTNIDVITANNNPYMVTKQYTITVIDSNPDSLITENVARLPKCKFVSHFTKDNLNHDIYNINY